MVNNTIIMQEGYMVDPNKEFNEQVKTVTSQELLASLDVQSLFTNVPTNDILDLIIDVV